MPLSAQQSEILSLGIYTVFAVLLIGALLCAAFYLGSGKAAPSKLEPYESGIAPTGSANRASQVPFYLVAIFFIVFDVEGAFIFTWGAAWDLLGIPGLVHITVFMVVLLLGLAWLWVKGGLEWGAAGRRELGRAPSRGERTV